MLDAAPIHAARIAPDPVAAQARGRGVGRVSVRLRDGVSRLAGLAQSGSARVFLPQVQGPPQAVLLNTGGGLAGGDRFDWAAEAEAGADLTVTTQAAERVYRALPGTEARVTARLTLRAGARLDWLPQETILFERGALTRRLEIDMAEDARLLAVEPLVLGRTAHGETVRDARLADHWRLRRGGRLVWADGLRLTGAEDGRAALGPHRACATLLLAAPDAAARLDGLRGLLAGTGLNDGGVEAGASAWDGLLVARMLAPDGRALRARLVPVLEWLRGAPLPRVWTM